MYCVWHCVYLQDERVSRTVARSFAPDFSFHIDFPCPLLWTDAGNDALSLAEILEDAEATFELWHQVPHGMPGMSSSPHFS
jgi:C2 domain-containing protein 3